MKTFKAIIIALLVLFVLAAGVWVFVINGGISQPDISECSDVLMNYTDNVISGAYSKTAESENGQLLRELYLKAVDYGTAQIHQKNKTASASVEYVELGTELLSAKLMSAVEEKLGEIISAARLPSEIYDENDNYRRDILENALGEALSEVETSDCLHVGTLYFDLKYSKKTNWEILNPEAADGMFEADFDELCDVLLNDIAEKLPHIDFHYAVEAGALAGPVPDQNNFGTTKDPAVVKELLSDIRAKKLIGSQTLSWNENIDFLPDSDINYYLDDTILMIQWQEVTAQAVGTYSEVIIADASQLRRKFVGDAFGGMEFAFATDLAKQTNSVLAVGGDLYNHARACGIVVYQGKVWRFEPNTCDTLYFDRDGNMLYSRRGEFSEQAQAEQLIKDNGVDFSICFGPVIVDNGEDVTPAMYPWGEINDTYARSAIGQLGERHYLTLNINCKSPNYYYLATLQDATDAMLAHGVYTAYALDGGQTAETIVNGVMINPVQFGQERMISDIIYFCTAIPNE